MLLPLLATAQACSGDHVVLPRLALGDKNLDHVLEEAGDGVDFEDADPGREVGLSAVGGDPEPVEAGEDGGEDCYADEAGELSKMRSSDDDMLCGWHSYCFCSR